MENSEKSARAVAAAHCGKLSARGLIHTVAAAEYIPDIIGAGLARNGAAWAAAGLPSPRRRNLLTLHNFSPTHCTAYVGN
ncbi:hypothetical protein GCM10027048_18140 [Hymenobacter coalescens]